MGGGAEEEQVGEEEEEAGDRQITVGEANQEQFLTQRENGRQTRVWGRR